MSRIQTAKPAINLLLVAILVLGARVMIGTTSVETATSVQNLTNDVAGVVYIQTEDIVTRAKDTATTESVLAVASGGSIATEKDTDTVTAHANTRSGNGARTAARNGGKRRAVHQLSNTSEAAK